MKKEELIALGLTEDLAEKVASASSEELKGYIPKSRFDEVNDQKKQLEKDVSARDGQLEDLKKNAGDSEALKKQITELQEKNTKDTEAFKAQMKQVQIDNAVDKALSAAGAKNTKAARALLDLANAEMDGDSVKGLADQIKKLAESEDTKFMFSAGQQKTAMTGMKPNEGSGYGGTPPAPSTLADAVKLHFESSNSN